MKQINYETYNEQCLKCGWILDENETNGNLEQDGAPISGIYYVCPKCKNVWCENSSEFDEPTEGYKKINIKKHTEIRMSLQEYEDLVSHM